MMNAARVKSPARWSAGSVVSTKSLHELASAQADQVVINEIALPLCVVGEHSTQEIAQ